MRVRIRRLPHAADLALPSPASAGSSGADLRAAISSTLTLAPGERALVPSGFQLEIPEGFEAQVRPRSGLALKHGVTVLNSPGTIDSDYRGEVGVILINQGREPFTLRRGDRMAQLVLHRVERARWLEADDLESSSRGEGGFGSSGV